MIVTDIEQLRKPCVDVLSEEIDSIRSALENELAASGAAGFPGIGLAAPQIGLHKKMAIVRVPDVSGNIISIDLINCRIKYGYDKSLFDEEGCLSFPGRTERTMRYQEVYVVNNLVPPYTFVAQGLVAVCIQHELDHLRGVLLPDVAVGKNTDTSNKNIASPLLKGLSPSLQK